MAQRITAMLLCVALVASMLVQYATPAWARAADQCLPALDVTGSLADEGESTYRSLYDGDVHTYLHSSAKGWQYVQFDFGCDIELFELRRYMTQDGRSTDGVRTSLGEGISYSRDGVVWFQVTQEISRGWDEARTVKEPSADTVPYRGFAWHSLPYGWSGPLAMTKPIRARFVRYNWEVANDRFHELALQYKRPDAFSQAFWEWSAWDWIANATVLVRYDDDNRLHPDQPVHLPWDDIYGNCYQENPDIAPSDGWVLLTGNFGTSLITPLPDYPYFVLYNKYRGLMRPYIFYGARRSIVHQATHQMGTLSVENGDVAAFTHYTGTYLHNFNPRYEQIFIKKDLLLNQWACLEFDVSGYDPAIMDASKSGASFLLHFYGLEESVLQAEIVGGLSGTLEESNVRMGQDGLSGALDVVTTVGGSFLKAANVSQDVEDALTKMKAKGDANPATWWGPALSALAAAGSQSAVPLISAGAGFITSLIDGLGGGNVPLSYRAELTGQFQLNGTIQTSPALSLLRFYVPGTLYGNTPELEPLYHEALGVYSLAFEPSIDYWVAPNGSIATQMGGTYGVGVFFDPSSVIVNPQSGLQLHAVHVSLVSPSYAPSTFIDASTYVGLPAVWMDTARFNSLKVGVQLQFQRIGQPPAPLITMYREYEATRENQGVWGDL